MKQKSWYALYTKHQHERTVASNLQSKGFQTFLPLYASARSWKDRVKVLSLPLFPCYVFLNTELPQRSEILKTPGIHDFVTTAGRPAVIPGPEIEGIRQAVGSGARVEPHPFVKCGDRVKVKCGPMTGLTGILLRKKNVYRLILSVAMLGKAAAVEVDAVMVEQLN